MNSDEPNLILPKFSRRLYFFFSSALWHLQKLIFSDENSQWFCILLCNFFASKRYRSNCRSRWENLDRGQYPFQPIKFVNLVVSSPCETEPYNNQSSWPHTWSIKPIHFEPSQLKNGYSSPTSTGTPPFFSSHCNDLITSSAWGKTYLISIAKNWIW